jgi:hypothetical protein
VQHAVDAITHLQAVLEGFDVHVGGARLDGALDQVIDEPHDRRLAGEVLEALDVLGFVGIGSRLDVIDDLPEHGLAAAIQPFDGRQDL